MANVVDSSFEFINKRRKGFLKSAFMNEVFSKFKKVIDHVVL